jgi:hypothetical protein
MWIKGYLVGGLLYIATVLAAVSGVIWLIVKSAR